MNAQVISFRCLLKNKLGRFISSAHYSEVINQAEAGSSVLTGLIEGLQNVKPGDKRRIAVAAERAYGFYDPELVQRLARTELKQGATLQVGSELTLYLPVEGRSRQFRVVAATDDAVVIDGNHPLAGQDLVFEVEITDARELPTHETPQSAPRASGGPVLH